MKNVIQQLEDFIKEAETRLVSNLWLSDDIMQVYVRKGRHILYNQRGKIATTLDIGAVVIEEDKRGQGVWTNFLEKAHELNPWEATFVECVHNPLLAESLLRNGWFVAPGTSSELSVQSYFMPKDMEKHLKQQFEGFYG